MTAPPMDTRQGIIAMCLSMATFLVNDAMVKLASERPRDQVIVVCLSGRGDKDAAEIARLRGMAPG